jgi:hypothetical protein
MNREPDQTESNLLCFLYGATKESELCQQYLRNAEESKDQTLAEFYREVQAQDRLRMWRIEELLRRQTSSTTHFASGTQEIL